MKTRNALMLLVTLAFVWAGCTKNDEQAAVFAGKPLLTRADGSVEYYTFLYDQGQRVTGIMGAVAGISYHLLDFAYTGTQLEWIPAQFASVYGHHIYYDINSMPTYSTLSSAPYSSSFKGTTQETDSIVFKNDNGKVTYKAYFGIFKNILDYSHTPSIYTTFIADSFIIYRMSYANGNIAKIRSEFKYLGRIVEEEFTWGTRKGVFSNIEPLSMVCPEFTSYGFLFISLLSKNELVSYTKTYVNENNRKVIYKYEYQYNSYGYPISLTQTESGTNNIINRMDFTYQ